MANKIFPATALIGGTDGCLDAYDGDLLSDGDGALVITNAGTYIYHLDATSAETEDSPSIIAPDDNAYDKRWILQSYKKASDADTVDGKHDYDFAAAAHASSHVGGADDIGLATTEADGLMAQEDKATLNVIQGFKNQIVNPEFIVNQRGSGAITANGAYPCDMWRTLKDATSTMSIGKEFFPQGDLSFPFTISSMLTNTFAGATGANTYVILDHRMEYVQQFAGRTLTLSIWAKASAAGKKLGLSLRQNFGTGGSPSALVDVPATTVALCELTTSWQKFTRTFNVPNIGGKTLGSDGNSSTSLYVWYSDGGSTYSDIIGALGPQSGTISISGPQLEYGTQATNFEKRNQAVDMLACYRFLEYATIRWSGITVSGSTYFGQYGFKVAKRATPTGIYTTHTQSGFAAAEGSIIYSPTTISETRTSNGASNSGGWTGYCLCSAEL